MGKKYIGEFTSYDHKDYRIEIEAETGSGTQNVTLGAIPFKTDMSSQDSHIYSPIKGTTATIQVLCEDYLFDIYSPSATGTKVKLIETTDGMNEVRWQGYVTPLLYNQGFKLVKEVIEIEAVDSISALEDIKYISNLKDIRSFLEELCKIFIRHIQPRYLYVSDNVQLNSATGTEQILDKLYVNEFNFFDEKSDETTLDDDVCWNCLDVISEIVQYLGYTCYMEGNDIWLVDYDAIKAGNAYYWRYDLTSYAYVESNVDTGWVNPDPIYKLLKNPERISVNHTHKVVGEDHKSSDASVSLDSVYNKIMVKADTFTNENTVGGNGETNITRLDATNFSSEYFTMWGIPITDYIWGEVFPADDDQHRSMDVWIDAHNDSQGYNVGGKHSYYDFVAMKFLKKPNCKFYIYDDSWRDITSQFEDYNMSYPDLKAHSGGIWVKYFTKNIDKTKGTSYIYSKFVEFYKEAKANNGADSSKYLDYVLNRAGIHSISWTEALLMHNKEAQTYRPNNEADWYKVPYYEMECEGTLVQGGDNTALIIQGQFYWSCVEDIYPMEYKDFKLDKKNWINPNEDMFIPASVQWGDLWWNGKDWQKTKCGFKLNWLEPGPSGRDDEVVTKKKNTIEAWKCQKTVMQSKPLTNTVDWRFGTSEEGCLIKMPSDGKNLVGKPKLTIYRPVSGRVWKSRKDYYNGDKNGKLAGDFSTKNGVRWPWYVVALLGLKFKSIVGDPSYSDATKSDTVYTNYLNNDSIKEMSTINFKVHTYDDKENSLGAVFLSEGESYVDKLYNKALYNVQKTWYDWKNNLGTQGLRQEENLIMKLSMQYEQPAKILDCILHSNTLQLNGIYTDTTLSDKYIVNKLSRDYKTGADTIRLIEKK